MLLMRCPRLHLLSQQLAYGRACSSPLRAPLPLPLLLRRRRRRTRLQLLSVQLAQRCPCCVVNGC